MMTEFTWGMICGMFFSMAGVFLYLAPPVGILFIIAGILTITFSSTPKDKKEK